MIRNFSIRRRRIAAILIAAIVCAQSAKAEAPPSTEDPYLTAQKDFASEHWAEAILSIRAALKAAPDDPRAGPIRMYLAEALLQENRPAEAAVELRAFLQTDAEAGVTALASYRLVECLYLAQDYAATIDAAEGFLDEHVDFAEAPRVRFYLGMTSYFTNDFAGAEAAIARLTADYPDHPLAEEAVATQAACLCFLNRPETAWVVLSARLPMLVDEEEPILGALAGEILAAAGDQAIDEGRLDDAETHFDRLLKRYPHHQRASYAVLRGAEIAHHRGDWTTAIDRFADAVGRGDLEPDMAAHASSQQLLCLAELQRWDDIVALAESAKAKYGNWPRAYEFEYLRGRALFAKAELNAARAAFALVTSAPASAGTDTGVLAHYMTAEAYALQRNYEAALVEYESAASGPVPEWQIAARMQCGKMREHLDRYDEAARDYERIVQEFADAPEAEEADRRRAACVAQAGTTGNLERK